MNSSAGHSVSGFKEVGEPVLSLSRRRRRRRGRYTQPRYTSVAYLRRTIHSTKLLGCTLEKSDSNLGIDSRYILLAKAFRILASFLNSRSGIPSFRVIEQAEKYLRELILKSYFQRNRNLYVIIKW